VIVPADPNVTEAMGSYVLGIIVPRL
jgi:hypothetical protein